MDELLKRTAPRTLLLAAGGMVLVSALAAWFYLIRGDLRELDRLRVAEREFVASGASASAPSIEPLEERVAALRERVYGQGAPASEASLTARIIERLDGVSKRHGVELDAVKPGARRTVRSFVEAPFDIEVSGGYHDLADWLHEAERELRPLVVKQFELARGGNAEGLRMRLRVASYLPARSEP